LINLISEEILKYHPGTTKSLHKWTYHTRQFAGFQAEGIWRNYA